MHFAFPGVLKWKSKNVPNRLYSSIVSLCIHDWNKKIYQYVCLVT